MYNQKKHEQVLARIANTYYYDKIYSNLLAARNEFRCERNTFLAGGWNGRNLIEYTTISQTPDYPQSRTEMVPMHTVARRDSKNFNKGQFLGDCK